MVVDIALGILLALLILAVGIAALAIFIWNLPVILTYVACVGSLWLLGHYLGGWGVAVWFCLLIGLLMFADREQIFKPASPDKSVDA